MLSIMMATEITNLQHKSYFSKHTITMITMKLMNHIKGKERIKLHICTLKLMTQVNKNHKVNKKNKLEL